MLLLGLVLGAQYSLARFDIAPFVGFRVVFRCSGCIASQRVSISADFGDFQLGPQFAYVDGEEYAVDFECGVFTGGDTVQICVNSFLAVSKGESVSASLSFENDGNSETLQGVAVAAHAYPEPPPTPKTGLIVGATVGGLAFAALACAMTVLLVRKRNCCRKAQK